MFVQPRRARPAVPSLCAPDPLSTHLLPPLSRLAALALALGMVAAGAVGAAAGRGARAAVASRRGAPPRATPALEVPYSSFAQLTRGRAVVGAVVGADRVTFDVDPSKMAKAKKGRGAAVTLPTSTAVNPPSSSSASASSVRLFCAPHSRGCRHPGAPA